MINTKKIIDCFIFYNELDLLYYRMNLLYEYIEYFVLVESNYTFAGNKKELFYKNNKYLFKKFENKIIHIIIDIPYKYPNINYKLKQQWLNEKFQRNSINDGINIINTDKFKLSNNDLIIISDLDEIISPKVLENIKNGILNIKDGLNLNMDFYYYNLNNKKNEIWSKAKIIIYNEFINNNNDSEKIRNNNYKILNNSGWHLSYFGDKNFISNKIKEFSHQEFNNNLYTNINNIENNILNHKDLYNRKNNIIKYININDNNNLPPKYDIYLNNYYENAPTEENMNENMNENNIKIYIYFHICCINNWVDIVSNLLFKIKNSGLYKIITEIRCVILGDYLSYKELFDDNKIKVIYSSLNINEYENITLNTLLQNSKDSLDDFYVLYIHSKGIKHYNLKTELNVYSWVEYLSYFNIYMYKKCINLLSKYNTIGVNLSLHKNILHYSGNFWWSKSSYIKTLNPIKNKLYLTPEFWITKNNDNAFSLYNSNVNHYNINYKFTEYEK